MHGSSAALTEAAALAKLLAQSRARAQVALCAPATLLCRLAQALAGSDVIIGAQDCHPEPGGAHTGDISAEMLADAGARMVIVGHSERRGAHRESDAVVRSKAAAALRAGLRPLICVGESHAEHELESGLDVVRSQVAASLPLMPAAGDQAPRVTIAYEPIWSIGTGLTPSIAQIEEMHQAIRQTLIRRLGEAGARVRILYGGSVGPDNARAILAAREVGGALVGRASLKAADFIQVIEASIGAEAADLLYSAQCGGRG
jgi:triosephosphate isomerase